MTATVQENPAKEKPAQEKPIAKVEIKGSADDYDPRRDDTASKTVILNAEIMKYGDTNVFDILKRAPGVTVIGNSIRMRGLGGNYTQILVNGERPPPGFSLDNLPPEQIEKIEVIRAGTAEHSMQAIAGTINIVLKKVVAKRQRDLRINGSRSDRNSGLFVNGTLADRDGDLSWFLNGALGRFRYDTPGTGRDQFTDPFGAVTKLRDSERYSSGSNSYVGLGPRLNWKLPDDGQLNFTGYLNAMRGDGAYGSHYDYRLGSFNATDYADYAADNDIHWRSAYGELNWITKLGGGKLDAKFTGSWRESKRGVRSLSTTADRSVVYRRDENMDEHNTAWSSSGKYTRTVFDDHALAAGWEYNRQRNDEEVTRIEGRIGVERPMRERFEPVVSRFAAYGQDEWNITKQWSIYLGARWEGIRTDSAGTGLSMTRSTSHVLSPVAQTLYKFPDKSGRQLRAALTRTYKAPTLQQLTARRYYAEENSRFSPDNGGNPDLKPELANGIDLTYEHFWAPGAVFSVGTSQRRIRDYIRSLLHQEADGTWIWQPINSGRATVRTFDVDVKFPLKALMKDAPAIDLRANFNRNWSTVDNVPGPHNVLSEQVPLTATLGIDYKGPTHSAGASLAFRGGGEQRVSVEQYRQQFRRRDLEAYWLYKFSARHQLRVTASNILGDDNPSYSRYVDAAGSNENWGYTPDSARLSVNLELKF
ncbi:TonB-dependent receptor plug domain-containing protein [Pseudoduganella flava]|uniref:TonB-dependent receptor plug domain-containing protein n=1 Tax=Pseudoduganella flava TaxID=871742 RepID=UPI001303A466|nr:TonB-dependent receptor [Pseudoduganella flava]